MKRLLLVAAVALLPFGCAPPAPPAPGQPVTVDQGALWSGFSRSAYYTVDQGSRLMPLDWFRALKQPDGTSFLAGRLSRYGYLRNYEAPVSDLPVGFTTNGPDNDKWVGMNCSACHTREIQVDKVSYRIDGGPAISDFQGFMTDLDASVAHLLADPATFRTFAADVLGGQPTDEAVRKLRDDVQAWFTPYDLIVKQGLPLTKPWGPSRLDAVGMIFNRLTGLDIGPAPDYTIPANVKTADAPVRYPFLWNASRQDFTQWPGFAANGDALLGLARNTGEVFGVFGLFHPRKDTVKYPRMKVDYTSANSSDT
ncbi:MAG: di-heme-cytochrome C peroxidase, partial [Rhodopila sp.]|nr:di-heme-cytochrome C peroxidase [Rhodopila sp.]